MKVVVLGATGRLGQEVVRECQKAGHSVMAVTRSARPILSEPATSWITLSPGDVAGHHRLFGEVDCVIDARNQRYDDWSEYPAMIDHTLSALDGTDARYVYVDNLYLYGYTPSLDPVDEFVLRRPVSKKGKIRLNIEAQLLSKMMDRAIAILRFPDFYGIVTDPLPRALRWFGPSSLPHQFIHIPDAAHALLCVAEDPSAFGTVWHVSGDDPITGHRLRELASEITGKRVSLHLMGPMMVRGLGVVFAPAGASLRPNIFGNRP